MEQKHPVKGYCYNIDGLCEEDHCRCWDEGEAALKLKIDENRERLRAIGIDWDRLSERTKEVLLKVNNKGMNTIVERAKEDAINSRRRLLLKEIGKLHLRRSKELKLIKETITRVMTMPRP